MSWRLPLSDVPCVPCVTRWAIYSKAPRGLTNKVGDLVGVRLGEPDRAVGAGGQPFQLPVAPTDAPLGHPPGDREVAELVRAKVGEPQRPIAGGDDVLGRAVVAHGVFVDFPAWCDRSDFCRPVLG